MSTLSKSIGTIFVLLAVCFFGSLAQAKYSGGTGEPNDPYQIATAEDLMLLGDSPEDYDKHFILTADIDLDPNLPGRKVFDRAIIASDTNDVTGGFQGIPFTGVFDGNDHMISHLTIEGESDLGLFGRTGIGTRISNLGLDAVDVIGDSAYVGGLVGCIGEWDDADIIVTNCYSTGSVTGRTAGGLVGENNGSITSSYSTCLVSGSGGLVGMNNGSISSSYSTGSVSGNDGVGGLVGGNGSSGNITSCYSTGPVTGNNGVGGLVGDRHSPGSITRPGSITASFWDIETSGQSTSAGGTGLTTSEMQDINTYLNEGWDFAEEVLNGTCGYWQISTGDYPRLRCQSDENLRMPEGLGTTEQPYLIRDANDLGTVWLKPKAHYRLETSLDLSGTTWSMPVVPWFGGTLEGNGHVISRLHIEGGGYLGLFGQLGFGARISNIGLEAVDVNGTGDSVQGNRMKG